jgi:nicotinamidase/pyrazinamidase
VVPTCGILNDMADRPRSALLIIDVQNDFCRGGALEVPQGDLVIPPLNGLAERIKAEGGVVCATRDWHPARSTHFKAFGGTWPVHCVAGTPGADFHPNLRLPPDALVFSTGQKENEDGYSAFDGVTDSGQPLAAVLRSRGVEHLYVGGLATDYCVKHSVLDGLKAGFRVTVLIDAVAGVEVQPGDSARALKEMEEAGAEFMATDDQADM